MGTRNDTPKIAPISCDDIAVIAENRDIIADFMRNAVETHADEIRAEIAMFDEMRERNPQRWAQIAIIKSILSSGADLSENIALAIMFVDFKRAGVSLETYDDLEPYRKIANYTGRSVGRNINAALHSWREIVAEIDPTMMTYQTLLTFRKSRKIMGHAHKTRRWSLAVYDARNRVYTLDVHMCRKIAALAGLERDGIKDNAYEMLEALMLDIHDTVCGRDEMPLVSQWAMWNDFRHFGTHATHIALAR